MDGGNLGALAGLPLLFRRRLAFCVPARQRVVATPAYKLAKNSKFSDGAGQISKSGDDKTSFAFMQVEGSVETNRAGTLAVGFDGTTVAEAVSRYSSPGPSECAGNIAGTSPRVYSRRTCKCPGKKVRLQMCFV